jgi:putative phosphoesterase
MKLVLMSDSHFYREAPELIRRKYPDISCKVHCGDIMMPADMMKGFTAVQGNMDFMSDYPFESVLEIDRFRILVKHGHDLFSGAFPDYRGLARYARQGGFQAVFFGHSHLYYDGKIEGVRLLNPGSVWRSRDGSPATYMIVEIKDGEIRAEKHFAVDLLPADRQTQGKP